MRRTRTGEVRVGPGCRPRDPPPIIQPVYGRSCTKRSPSKARNLSTPTVPPNRHRGYSTISTACRRYCQSYVASFEGSSPFVEQHPEWFRSAGVLEKIAAPDFLRIGFQADGTILVAGTQADRRNNDEPVVDRPVFGRINDDGTWDVSFAPAGYHVYRSAKGMLFQILKASDGLAVTASVRPASTRRDKVVARTRPYLVIEL